MPLTLIPNYERGIIDSETNSQLVIESTPEIDTLNTKFKSGSVALRTVINIKSKFPDRPVINNNQTNPRVMISAGAMNGAFLSANMHDIERNSELVKLIVRMIIFANKIRPLAVSPYLWSDHHKLRAPLYRMPSDQALLDAVLVTSMTK